ncbi:MAG TPA: glycoside hydrolase family 15 protein [Thermoanaerobaculia bacterium]|nr:glycoside hydrolase family 15 protein [Thermoanaerobaculia bacterium]
MAAAQQAEAIADYAVIGDTRSIALISRRGSIDWLSWPRFDAPSIFARLLDVEKGGHFSIAPPVPFTVKRRYIDDTNVLETTFTCDGGEATLIDLMPVMTEEEKTRRLTPFRQILRRVECVRGEVPLRVEFVPRPDYARITPRLELRDHRVHCAWGARVLNLRSDARFDERGIAEFTLRAGERRTFVLGYDDHSPAVFAPLDDDAVERSIEFWRNWSSQLAYKGPYRDMVMRSALVLKLLTYAPSGGIVAAATTSLPEEIGGVRNWDYRYCWLRDASFTVSALYDCGFEREGAAFLDWLLYATRITQPRLQILYDVFGESKLPERDLDHLAGYRGSRPVRVGNLAVKQFQLDVYGEVIGAMEEAVQRGEALDRDRRRLIHRLAQVVAKRWSEPDDGIWEKRGGRRHHIHSKIMAWSALDCAERLIGPEFSGVKDQIRDYVLTEGFNQEINSFVAVAGERDVDASLLYAVRVGIVKPDDPRMLGTIDAIRRQLGRGDLVYRYDTRSQEDGLPAGEGAFLACSMWLVEALVLAGRRGEAEEVFAKVLRRANDVGLLSEEADPDTGELLGNFPQALTHIGLMNAALCLSEGDRTSRESARSLRARA